MPQLTGPFLTGLLDAAEAAGAGVLLPAGPSGRPEPLCAVYHADARDALEMAFRAGERKVMRALAGLRHVILPVAEILYFQNVNTPEDWAGYAAE
jgi:molybdopterin-guanine dinucleotide biosynthesis protein A